MEWDPIQNQFVEVENIEHEELLIQINYQIEEHIHFENEYENYINNLLKNEKLVQLNNLIKNYENNNNFKLEFFKKWSDVPNFIQVQVKDILIYRLDENFDLTFDELDDYEIYLKYIIYLANIIQKLYLSD